MLLLVAGNLAALPADRAITQYVRRAWTVERELPHNTVRGLAQTADGYLWLATYEGLVRFDGEKFRVFDKAFDRAVISNSIVTLTRTADGTLWLGTLAGLMRYRGGHFEPIAMPGGQDIVNALAATADGTVWVGTARGRLLRIDGSGHASPVQVVLLGKPITALAASHDDVWIGTSAGLSRYRDGKLDLRTAANGLSSDTVVTLAADGDDGLLVGTAAGLDRIADLAHGGRVEHVAGLPADQITALRRDRDSNLWIGTYSSGLFRLAGNGIASYGTADGLLNPTVRAIFEDDEGSLWI
ncbi:MAG: hypothetical protein JWO56_3290, partial [Acidobacteria bacterium]|nr:hypothetical protein [Acidobacteriota bacterium]